jgi:penicillin-binding protein 1C
MVEGASRALTVPRITKTLILLLSVQVVLIALDAAFPPDMRRARESSPVAMDRNGVWLRALPVEDGRWRIRADLSRTDPSFVRRLIAVEDGRFWLHPGVDPLAVARATASAAVTGHARSGASTLTMQTARLLTPRPRTVPAKLVEMVRAVQLEARMSKREILALYLTLAPYGGNLEGVRAASLAYFAHEPESLTAGEQALLIALPQSPEVRRPDRRPAAAQATRAEVADKLVRARLFTPTQGEEAKAEPLPGRTAFPALAWHIAGEAAARAPASQASVVTTLDAALQARLERLAADAAAAQGPEASAAILVIEVNGRAVRAAVGSAGRERAGGWIDMTRALRSPGSTLKPFIYGFAFDDGVAAPDTVIDDRQTRFADYQPENFDRVFHGRVTAREALLHSLNVPAVATLERIGPANFQSRLEASGATLVRPDTATKEAGLALALGGEGITLRDLALLYAALADGGVAKPLAWTEEEAARRRKDGGVRLMREAAARSVLDILRETPAPEGRPPSALTRRGPRMAFKTGTSYGFRDAVSAGAVGGYVIVVWTGRADGGARGGLTGRDVALPLLFDAADAIDSPGAAPRPIAPRGAPKSLGQLARPDGDGPRLIFPPNGAAVRVEALGPKSRGLVLAATGETLRWYVSGEAVPIDPVAGRPVWRPQSEGFYDVRAVDPSGREARARVRIRR